MSVEPADQFSSDYRTARERFLRAAEQRGAALSAHAIEPRGARGEELSVDVAYVGPRDPGILLVVSSGLHGVEGFAGSAIQHQLLTAQLDGLDLPRAAGLLLVHALNPFGFATLRRVNESNVDLNRNFLRHPDEHVPSPDYDHLYSAINPETLDDTSEQQASEALRAFVSEHGPRRLQEVVSAGQYVHPRGMQFGGHRDEASNRIARQIVREHVRGTRVAWVDVHTGLGAYGDFVMLTALGPERPAMQRGRAWYGAAAQSVSAGEAVSPMCHGSSDLGLATEFRPDCAVTFFAQEFGTYDPKRVFRAMRADNWLQFHGDADSEHGRVIKAELLEVFRPADPAWQRSVLDGGARVIQQARDGLASDRGAV
jgi:uncharacterized protein DUF2817